jgi:hypothetical protein
MYGGPFQDKASSLEIIVRHNPYRNVLKGPFWNVGHLVPTTPTALLSLARDLDADPTGKTAVATTAGNHALQPGERVKISTATGPSQYRGVFVVRGIPATNKFQ